MAVTKITALPTPPSTTDAKNFDTRADAFVKALPNFVTEANKYAVELENACSQGVDDINSATEKQIIKLASEDEVLKKLIATQPLLADTTYNVGTSDTADYATINEALAAASKLLPVVDNKATHKVYILLEQGFVWAETIDLKNIKLDFVSLGMKPAESVATMGEDGVETYTTPALQPIQVKLSALTPISVHNAKTTALISLDNASLSIDSLQLEVMAESDLGEANSGTIELIRLCDNATLYANALTLDTTNITAATNDYKAIYAITNSSIYGNSLNVKFDNSQKLTQPAIWIKDKSNLSFDSIEIDGAEAENLVKEPNQRLFGVYVTNQSVFYSSNKITLTNLNYAVYLQYSTIGFEIYEHSKALVSMSANASTIARGNITITQDLTADTNATQVALELTNCVFKAINITFKGIGFLNSKDSDIDIFGFVTLTSIQPQANLKNTWKCEVRGGVCNINTLKYTPQVESVNDFISYPALSAPAQYSGLFNAGEGVNFKVTSVDISNITLQWLALENETQATHPKGLFAFGGGRFQISKAAKLADFGGSYIDSTGTSSTYPLNVFAATALPNMLSQLALGDFSVLTANHSNLDESNPTTQLATGTLALVAKGVPPVPTLSVGSANSGIASAEMNFGFWNMGAGYSNRNCPHILGYQSARTSKTIEIYADRDLTGGVVNVEKGGVFKSCYNYYYYDYYYDYDYDYVASISGNKITLTIYSANKKGNDYYSSGRQGEDNYFLSASVAVLNSVLSVTMPDGSVTNAINIKVGSW